MEKRYLENPFPDYKAGREFNIDKEHVRNLICTYVDAILEATKPDSDNEDRRGDLYVGNAGIAYMFWRLSRSPHTNDLYPALEHAEAYIRNAKANAIRYKKRPTERNVTSTFTFLNSFLLFVPIPSTCAAFFDTKER